MKIARTIFYLSLLLVNLNVFGQSDNVNNTFKIGSYLFPSPNVNDITNWLNLTTSEWEKEMKKFSFYDRSLKDGCVKYMAGTAFYNQYNAVYSVSKCPGNIIKILWTDFSKSYTILDNLVGELEPHYTKDMDGFQIYTFEMNSRMYQCSIHHDYELETVIIKMFK